MREALNAKRKAAKQEAAAASAGNTKDVDQVEIFVPNK